MDFEAYGPALRHALRQVPTTARYLVELDEALWRRLLDAPNLQAWCRLSSEWDDELGPSPGRQQPSDDEAAAQHMDDFMYRLATGELTIGKAEPIEPRRPRPP